MVQYVDILQVIQGQLIDQLVLHVHSVVQTTLVDLQ